MPVAWFMSSNLRATTHFSEPMSKIPQVSRALAESKATAPYADTGRLENQHEDR